MPILVVVACGKPQATVDAAADVVGDVAVSVHAMGNAQKGPLLTGSSVQVFPLDANLVPVGTVFTSQIADDLGSFDLSFTIAEPFVEVVVNGFYFDELTSNPSGASLTLRAYARWQQASSLRVNLLTTIAENRTKFLVQHGQSFDSAAVQAKNEIFASFAIDGTSLDDLVTMDITAANANSAALIATSGVLLEHAASNSSTPGERVAVLSLATSQIANDLKDDGVLSAPMAHALARAAHFLDLQAVEGNLHTIYQRLGITIVVPALAPYIDPLADRYAWARPVATPTGGDDAAACAIGTKIYLAGSCDSPTACGTKQLLELDAISGSVTSRAAMPTQRAYATCGVVGGKLYIFGGLSNGNDVMTGITNVDRYDPATDTWVSKAASSQANWRRPVAVVNNQIYLVGSSANLNVPTTASLDRYDPATDTWSALPPMSTARALPAVCAVGGKIYVFGGAQRMNATLLSLQSIEVYDVSLNAWSSRTPMSGRRDWAGCSEVGGQLYVMGGEDIGAAVFASNDKYEPSTDTWLARTPMDQQSQVHAATVVNNTIFAFDSFRIDRYDPAKE